MRNRWFNLLVLLSLILGLMPVTAVQAAAAQAPSTQPSADVPRTAPLASEQTTEGIYIRLQQAVFDPLEVAPPINPSLIAEVSTSGPQYYLVQFEGPVRPAWKQSLSDAGVAVLDYVPDFAFVVRMDAATARRVERFRNVRWVGLYQPAFRLENQLLANLAYAKPGASVELVLRLFAGETAESVLAQLSALRVEIVDRSADRGGGAIYRVRAPETSVAQLAHIPALAWIEPYREPALSNEIARSDLIMGKDYVEHVLGLYGQNQIVAVGDTGLSTGNPATAHQDFAGRIIGGTWGPGSCGTWADNNSHGTHVAGSVLGSGFHSGADIANHIYAGSNAGIAPEALLYVWGFCNDFSGLPDAPYNDYYGAMYGIDARLRINTNSWGYTTGQGLYNAFTRETDRFVWDHPDMVLVYAAGNEGIDGNGDGVVDLNSINMPSTAKNVITVGGSENYRLTGGATGTWGQYWPSDFPANPIRDDRVSDNPDGMVAFSGRGPTSSGRLKPDVVAPGSNIVSTRNESTGTGWGIYDAYYLYMGGTSMATPLVAGASAVVRDFFTSTYGLDPGAALVKATLINGAYDMTPGQYGAGPTQDVVRRPDYNQGWGRVDLTNSLVYEGARDFWFYEHAGLNTSELYQATFTVSGDTSPFRVTLAWSDYPGVEATHGALVNDLDLEVEAPDGTVYYGNDILDGVIDDLPDRLNNIEGVDVNPQLGTYIVRVKGYNVPQAPQPFALVVTGDMPSNRGDLEGTVYVAGGAPGDDPIAGASVSAINAGGQLARMATSDDDGFYSMSLAMGTYTVTAMAFGYQPAEIGAAEVVSGQVTALDIPLSSATWYTVSGVVRDAATGWPLYAHIAVSSDPLTPPAPYNSVWTDPATGYYSLSLPEGITYTLTATAWVDGYLPGNAVVPPLTGNVTQDIELDADMEACSAPGYEIPYIHLDDFESDDGGYTVSGVPADHWQWGSPVTWPGSCAAGVHCWGTNLTGNYANNAAAVLTSPVIDLSTASAPLAANWRQAWHLESATWDHGYAEISINGGPWQVMWQHTGGTIQVDWTKMSYDISAAAGGSVQFRFRLTSDSSLNYAGYYIDLVNITGAEGCQIPLDGGLIVGNVYDANYPAEALNGADIVNAAGYAAESLPTPLDDAVDDGFYTVFAPAGTQTFTATAMAYSASVVDVTVVDGDTVTQDFFLPTGLLSAAPDGLDVTVELGYADTRTLNLTNAGGAAATFAFEERAGSVNPLAITGLEEEKQLAAPTGGASDVPWLAEDPITGTVPAAGDMAVTVAFDAAYVDQPGEYHAELVVINDTPYGEVRVPVTMTVTGPASWAKLTGTVIGLGVCDDDPAPLGAAEVYVESATTGQTWLVTTDISGTYHLWMDQAHSPVTITVTAPDYFGETGGVLVVQGETTVVDFDLRLLKPCLSYDPADFHVTLPMGDNTVELLTLSNSGAALAEFELMEVIGGFTPLNLKVNISFPRSDAPLSFERAPLPEESGKPFINPNVALQVGAPAYGVDLLGDQFVYFTMDDATNPTNIATATRNYYAGDFINGDFSTLYAIDNATQMLYAIDTASGAQTAVGASVPQSGHTWTGMAGDPTTGVMYACSTDGATNALYILNLASGAPTLVGTHGGGFVLIDIAISSTGQMYGVDINTDQLVAIDKASGVITAIGSLGFDASYAQGMDFDEASGTLYLAAYNAALSRAELRIADTSTGATVLVSTIGAGSGVELDAFAIATTGSAGSAIPWLTETPISSTIAADTDAVVDLTFDAGVPETMQPGTYYGQLKVAGNAANDVPNIPVTLTVTAPDTWGKVAGVVTGLGYCDVATPTLLEEAEVTIESGTGLVEWLLLTDENGAYQFWLDAAHSPVDITIAYPDHITQVFTDVVVTAGETTVRNAALRWAMPCLTVEPDLFDVTVTLGMSTTLPFSLTNRGAADAAFTLLENDGGFTITGVQRQLTQLAAPGPSDARVAPAQVGFSAPVYVSPTNAETLFDEGFEGGVVPPAGWTSVINSSETWKLADYDPHGGAYNANVEYDYNQDEWLLSPELMLTEGVLSFWSLGSLYWCRDDNDNCDLNVWIVVGPDVGDGDDIFVGTADDDWPANWTWAQTVFDLAPLLPGGPVRIGFQYWGDDGAEIGLDDIVLVGVESGDIPWLSEDPESGAVAADSTFIVDLTFDASEAVTQVTQLGEYFGTLFVNSDDPFNNRIPVPVTMTVLPPATWGKLVGTVTGLGYCDADPAPVAGADVLVESWMTETVTALVPVTVWSTDFEADNGGFAVTSVGPSTWAWGAPTSGPGAAYSGVNVWATNLAGDYSINENGYITSPSIDLSAYAGQSVDLQWWQYYEGENCCDFISVEISNDGGATWSAPVYGPFHGGNVNEAVWEQQTVTLDAAYAVSNFQVRFHFTSDASVFGAGWYVDDVVIETMAELTMDVPISWALTTDVSGTYQVWLDEMYSPVTITVSAADHTKGEAMPVVVIGGAVTEEDFDLRWLEPCVTVAPDAIVESTELGMSLTVPMTMANTGAVDSAWNLHTASMPAWLSAAPTAGTIVADTGVQAIAVTLDSGILDQPGEYIYMITSFSDDPLYPVVDTPVTFTVTPPASWGQLTGEVSSTGHCDVNLAPLAGADVLIESWLTHLITISVPLIEEGFEGTFPPAGWVLRQTGAIDDPGWLQTTARANNGNYSAYHDDDNLTGNAIAWMIMPQVAVPAGGAELAFWQNQNYDSYYAYHGIWVSTASADPADFSEMIELGAGTEDTWEEVTLDLSAYAGQSIYIAFRYEGDYADEWYVDDVIVFYETQAAAPLYSVNLTTDAAGMYSYWLPTGDYTVTVAATDHAGDFAVVTVPASGNVMQDFSLTWLGPCVTSIAPSSMEVTVAMGMSTTLPLTMTNAGAGALDFRFAEMNGGFTPMLMMPVQQAIQASTVTWNVEKLAGECAVYQDSILAEPAAAWDCYDSVPAPQTFGMQPLAPTDTGYAQDIGYISDNFVSFALNNFTGQTVVGTSTNAYYGMDFDSSATTFYALNDATDQLGTIDLTTGAFTGLAPCPPGGGASNWTGLTIDPVNGTFYASTATALYIIDPATGASTLVGTFGGGSSSMIDIAMNPAGEIYGHDIATDSIYRINPATGAATLIGLTGYNANFAQGMDFDNDDGTLYIFLYQGGGANVYGTVNLMTGAVTPLAVSAPQGEFEGAIQIAGAAGIPWLFEDPVSGAVAPATAGVADITFDAGVSEVTQPGDYFGVLTVNNSDPVWDGYSIPVTMHVTLPETYGQITGTVMGLGPCDDPLTAMALEGADVIVTSATQTWTLSTDAGGVYALWLDEVHSPVTITVGALDYVGQVVTGVTVISDTTTVRDFILRPLAPCATVAPSTIEEVLTLGMSTTVPITIGNTGAYTLAWTLSENGGVAWMDQDPPAGETAPDGGTSAVTVTLDAAGFAQPGVYTAALFVDNDSVNDPLVVPVTLTVEVPATWGKLDGLVQGLGHCDVITTPLEGAVVFVESAVTTDTWTLATDASGAYGLWLDELYSPLTVTISYEAGYDAQVFTDVAIVSGTVTTLNANLLWLQPCITVAPDTLVLSVSMGTSTTVGLNLANMGAFTGSFLLNEWSLGFEMLGLLAAGGPDAFGYRFADSNDAGIRPVYDFVDISGIGTPVALGDNDFAAAPIGFDFKFYGASAVNPNVYDTVFVGSNGFLSFGAGSTDFSPDPVLPNPTLPNNLIAAAWDDLVPGTVYVQSFAQCPYNPDPNTVDACFIVQYDAFTHAGGAPAGTWEVILFHSGSILMQYVDVDAPNATTGIEGPLGVAGLNYGPVLADELAICFAYPGEWLDCQSTQVPWLDADVDEGDIPAYDDVTVAVTLDASVPEVAQPGDYLAELWVISDDPFVPLQIIPVTMTVEMPATMARLSGDIYGWGYCDALSETLAGAVITIETENGGDKILTADAEGAYAVWVEAGQITITIAHDGYIPVVLTEAVAAGIAPQHDVHLYLDAPCAAVTYDQSFDVIVVQDQQFTRTLMLNNDGAGLLTYNNAFATALWLAVSPMTGSVAPRSAQSVDVLFDATGLAVGVYSTTMEIVHNDTRAGRLFVRPIRMTVVADGTILLPVMDAKEGNPGETVTYAMTVTNFADTAVTFDVLASGHVWTTTVPATVTVAANGTATFDVDVEIPIDAHTGYSDTVTITAESQGADGQIGVALLRTTVAEQPVVLALTKTAAPADYVLPGDTITYTITFANNGNDPVTVTLTDPIPAGTTYVLESVTGGATFNDLPGNSIGWDGVLAKGAQHTITFRVTVNAGLEIGTLITNTVTALANGLPFTSEAVVTVGAAGPEMTYIYLPLVLRNMQ